MARNLKIILASLFLCSLIFAGGLACASSPDTNTNTGNTQTSSQSSTSATPKPKGWKTLKTFEGNGAKKTEKFSVPGEWQIKYSCKGQGILGAFLYINGQMNSTNVNETCPASGVTAAYDSGDAYLDVNATTEWKIEIQIPK